MPDRSDALAAAVRAVRGESALDAVLPALSDWQLAQVIALAPVAHPVVRAIATLFSGWTSLLNPPTVTDPGLHAALVRLIGTSAGRITLRSWAEVASAGWGLPHAAEIRNAVRQGMCDARTAAALIGPDDESAALLHAASDAAFAIRRWGQADPAAPTTWAKAIALAQRGRLLDVVRRHPSSVASCLPWLPPEAAHAAKRIDDVIGDALDAFAVASPTARALHAAVLRRLVAHALPEHLDALTRLACATGSDDVWRRVQTLIRTSPDDAWRVVAAAPWDDLQDDVRAAILRRAAGSSICAAAAFFAALDPPIWDAREPDEQRRWLHALTRGEFHLAVRSLGLRPEILTRAPMHNLLVRAAQRHTRDEDALRWALMPIVLNEVAPVEAHALIAVLPTLPSDPGAFFCVAGMHGDPKVIAPARSVLRTPADLAIAVTIQRSVHDRSAIPDRCTAVQQALRGWSRDDLTPFMPILNAEGRDILNPDRAAIAARLARPDRQDALRRTLDRLSDLPPEVDIPARFALTRWETESAYAQDAADALVDALCAHGDLFLAMVDALADDRVRAALLPLPEDPALAGALRALARDDPPTARRLAQALRGRSWRDALITLLHAPPHPARAVWQALDDDARRAIGAVVAAASSDAAPIIVCDPIAALALAALRSSDADLRDAGSAALTARPEVTRSIWKQAPHVVQQIPGAHLAIADLHTATSHRTNPPSIRRRLRREHA